VSGLYDERAATHAAARDVENRRSILISRLRLATFLPGAACLLWLISRASVPIAALAAVCMVAFAVLVVWHARVDERVAWFEALRLVNVWASARVARDWTRLPAVDPPATIDLAHHPYALDLDLFGRASLAQWLGPSATPAGASLLAAWLLEAADVSEIKLRQAAVSELASVSSWREQLFARGVVAAGERPVNLDRFFAWAEGPGLFNGREPLWHSIVLALTFSIWLLFSLHLLDVLDAPFWLIPVLAGMVLSFATASRVHGSFDRAGAGQRALTRYAGLFEHALASPAAGDRLGDLHARLTAEGYSAPNCMRQLNRILGFAELRTGAAILHFLIHALTLWDFHVAFALDRWRHRAGRRVRAWIAALGEIDALSSLATIGFDNPTWCTPQFEATALVTASDLGHPLLPEDRRIANDVEIGPPGTVLVITGSNMSGKSTLLRAAGLNIVLAQAGGPVCATALRMPPGQLQASIRVQDSLELGLSYFMAALARLKGIVDAAERPRPGRELIYLLDEILQGTNSAERSIAVRGIVRHLLEARAIGALTTHDLAVVSQPPLDRAARLVHFTETVDQRGAMSFDYRLRPGLATSRNALRLMQLIGIDLRPDEHL
jgi:hypothetical protein